MDFTAGICSYKTISKYKAGPAIFSPVALHSPRCGMNPRPRQAGLHRSLWHQIPHYSPPARGLHSPAPPPPLPQVLYIPSSPDLSHLCSQMHRTSILPSPLKGRVLELSWSCSNSLKLLFLHCVCRLLSPTSHSAQISVDPFAILSPALSSRLQMATILPIFTGWMYYWEEGGRKSCALLLQVGEGTVWDSLEAQQTFRLKPASSCHGRPCPLMWEAPKAYGGNILPSAPHALSQTHLPWQQGVE